MRIKPRLKVGRAKVPEAPRLKPMKKITATKVGRAMIMIRTDCKKNWTEPWWNVNSCTRWWRCKWKNSRE